MRTSPTNNDSEEFIQRFGSSQFPYADELCAALRAGGFFRIVRTGSQPCRQLAEVYHVRAMMLDHYHHQRDSDLWREFTSLADTLSESPDEPCQCWLFRGASFCFTVFEMVQSHRIAGCFKRGGQSEDEIETHK